MLIGFEWITAAAALPLDGNVVHRIIRRQRITVTVIGAASLIQAQGYDLTEFGKIPLRPLFGDGFGSSKGHRNSLDLFVVGIVTRGVVGYILGQCRRKAVAGHRDRVKIAGRVDMDALDRTCLAIGEFENRATVTVRKN